jgi:predicted RecB family endonuclease
MYPAVKQDDIMEVLVPQLEGDLAERVKELVTSSSKLLEQSHNALEKMKGLAENALTST